MNKTHSKTRMGLLMKSFKNTIRLMSDTMTWCNINDKTLHKYSDNNWSTLTQDEYLDKLLRHLWDYLNGMEYDPDSGAPPLVSVAWNALALSELYLKEITKTNGGK